MKTPLFSSRHNHRYPYGLTFADAWKGASVQPYKSGGKELDAMYGLNIYDSTYKSYGNKFANSYKHIPNYNVPVNKVPNTLKYLLRK